MRYFSHELSESKKNALNSLFENLTAHDCDTGETNLEAMQHLSWQPLRVEARKMLEIFEWPLEAPSEYAHAGNGVLHREVDL
jgi:hypothetical protein